MRLTLSTFLILVFAIHLTKFRVFAVVSGSMEPTIKNGSLVIVRKSQTYKTSDLITFKHAGGAGTLTHRIVKIELSQGKYAVFTKGDGNAYMDENTITPQDIIGKVTLTVPLAGKFISTVTSQEILPITFYTPAGLLFGVLVKKLKLNT